MHNSHSTSEVPHCSMGQMFIEPLLFVRPYDKPLECKDEEARPVLALSLHKASLSL